MTFAEFKAAVYAETIPDKESVRLTLRHEGWIKSALIDLQLKVKCLQSAHTQYIQQAETFYTCGTTLFPIPAGGIVKSMRVEETEKRCNGVDVVPQTESVFRGIRNTKAGRCAIPKDAPAESVEEVIPSTPALDLGYTPSDRSFSIFDGNIWLWPVLNSTQTIVLKWSGVKRSWEDADVMPWLDEEGNPDYEVQEAVQWFFYWKRYQFDLCDMEKAGASLETYRLKRSDMMVDCVRKAAKPSFIHVMPDPRFVY